MGEGGYTKRPPVFLQNGGYCLSTIVLTISLKGTAGEISALIWVHSSTFPNHGYLKFFFFNDGSPEREIERWDKEIECEGIYVENTSQNVEW